MIKQAVQVENLGKRYRLGELEPYRTLRDALTRAVRVPLRTVSSGSSSHRIRRRGASPREAIWALRNVSFDVEEGEVFGIIGRNGAGKTTLLKVLSRITAPTEGRAEIRGRVGSLLEVGTGFHPELTGRENVYLNGAILGMKKGEIDQKFDEIVTFAEVEDFIGTPVKAIEKSTKPARTAEAGRRTRGKYVFETRRSFATRLVLASPRPRLKRFHGRRAAYTKTG